MSKFYTFEGLDGCGKTTLVEHVKASLYNTTSYREPGGCEVGEAIRDIVKKYPLERSVRIALFQASRDALYHEKLKHTLFDTVLLDRWIDSTVVYQYVSRQRLKGDSLGLPIAKTFLIDTPVDICMGRRASEEDVFEVLDHRIWMDRRLRYLNLAYAEPERFVVLDGTQSIAELTRQVVEVIKG